MVTITRGLSVCVLALHLCGCTVYSQIDNNPLRDAANSGTSYSVEAFDDRLSQGDNSFILAFSGGGTRAAALSYGVLKALRDISVETSEGNRRLIDEVDSISSVSGGSFTSAYYGLYGDDIFKNFETEFLRTDVQRHLLDLLFNPINWFKISHRTDWAIDYYEKNIFHGATYTDLLKAGGPMIMINASDLTGGNGMWFTQEYFDLLCSDILDFPLSRAVAASSAVPGVFAPVVLENYAGCSDQQLQPLETVRAAYADSPEMSTVLRSLESYADKAKRPYIQLVDGGITDNLGLRGLLHFTALRGGAKNYFQHYGRKPPRRIVIVVVNASTESDYEMNLSNRVPSLSEVIEAMSSAQLHRYNTDTLANTQLALEQLGRDLSRPGQPVATFLINLNFEQVKDPEKREFLNRIPTSFSLNDTQVDALIETGGELLRQNQEFRRLMAEFTVISTEE